MGKYKKLILVKKYDISVILGLGLKPLLDKLNQQSSRAMEVLFYSMLNLLPLQSIRIFIILSLISCHPEV